MCATEGASPEKARSINRFDERSGLSCNEIPVRTKRIRQKLVVQVFGVFRRPGTALDELERERKLENSRELVGCEARLVPL